MDKADLVAFYVKIMDEVIAKIKNPTDWVEIMEAVEDASPGIDRSHRWWDLYYEFLSACPDEGCLWAAEQADRSILRSAWNDALRIRGIQGYRLW